MLFGLGMRQNQEITFLLTLVHIQNRKFSEKAPFFNEISSKTLIFAIYFGIWSYSLWS